MAVMVPVFRLAARRFGDTIAWFLGLGVYWLLWGLGYSIGMLGSEAALDLLRPRPFRIDAALLALMPPALAAIGRFRLGMMYEKSTRWAAIGSPIAALGNGFFEELLWRGTYLALFRQNVWVGVLWSGLWFGLGHYAPGSVSNEQGVRTLMTGAIFLGIFLSVLTYHTGTIWWAILSHTLAGLIMVL